MVDSEKVDEELLSGSQLGAVVLFGVQPSRSALVI